MVPDQQDIYLVDDVTMERGRRRLLSTIRAGVDPKANLSILERFILERYDSVSRSVPVSPTVLTRAEILADLEARKSAFWWACRSCGSYGVFHYVVGDQADFDRHYLRMQIEHMCSCDGEPCSTMED